LERYKDECKFVWRGTYFDIFKVFKDGKSLILEGSHIDPKLYSIACPSGEAILSTNKDLIYNEDDEITK